MRGRTPIPPEQRRTSRVAVYMLKTEAEALDRLCERLGGVTRSDALRAALVAAVAGGEAVST